MAMAASRSMASSVESTSESSVAATATRGAGSSSLNSFTVVLLVVPKALLQTPWGPYPVGCIGRERLMGGGLADRLANMCESLEGTGDVSPELVSQLSVEIGKAAMAEFAHAMLTRLQAGESEVEV